MQAQEELQDIKFLHMVRNVRNFLKIHLRFLVHIELFYPQLNCPVDDRLRGIVVLYEIVYALGQSSDLDIQYGGLPFAQSLSSSNFSMTEKEFIRQSYKRLRFINDTRDNFYSAFSDRPLAIALLPYQLFPRGDINILRREYKNRNGGMSLCKLIIVFVTVFSNDALSV
jgi:hypothetical protein